MTDDNKTLIEAINLLEARNAALEAYIGVLNEAGPYRPGWWVGVVLLAMCLLPWVLLALVLR